MKRILQAMDGVATKPVVGADSMAKFLSVIDKNDVEILNEATNPHKVSLPVQMAMQHYQQTPQIEKKKFTNTGIRKFFHEVEQEVAEEKTNKQQLLRQYSQTIAERVLMREFKERDHDDKEHGHKLNTNKLSVKANRFLQQAHQMSPGDEGDIEAMAAAASELADTAKQQQVTIDRQMDMYTQLQDLLANTEERFRDLNAKVASGEVTQQDAAVAAQEIERHHDTEKGEIAKQHKHDVEPEKMRHAEPTQSSTQSPAVAAVAAQPKAKPKTTATAQPRAVTQTTASSQPATAPRAVKATVPTPTTSQPETPAVNPFAQTVAQMTGQHAIPNIKGLPTRSRVASSPNNDLANLHHPDNPASAYIQSLLAGHEKTSNHLNNIKKGVPNTADTVAEDARSAIAGAVIKAGSALWKDLVASYSKGSQAAIVQYPTGYELTIPRNEIGKLITHHMHGTPEMRTAIENDIIHYPGSLRGFLKAPVPTSQQSLPLQGEMPFNEYTTRELSHAKILSTGPGPQDNVLDHDGRDQLGLEEAPSTMEPMKRYRMMRRISKRAGIDLSDLEHATDDELHHLYKQHGLTESPMFDQPDRDVHNPDVSHGKANTHPLETVINMANHDIIRLADDVKSMQNMDLSSKLLLWQRIAQEFTTGGVMQTLAGRAAQIAHGIEQLKQARQTGKGVAPKRRSQISKHLE